MKLNMDAEQLRPLIKAFYEFSGIKIAIYDNTFSEILSYPEQNGDFCAAMRRNDDFRKKCDDCAARLCRQCAEENRTIIYRCHAGLSEVVAPLASHDMTIGYVIYGQMTNEPDADIFLQEVKKLCADYGICESVLEEKIKKIRYYNAGQIEATLQIVKALTLYIVLKGLVYVSEQSDGDRIAEYIDSHLAEDLSVGTLCRHFAMSKAKLYACVKELMPQGIAKYVRKKRVVAAMELMKQFPDKPFWKISEECGFENYDYFLRVFKTETGIPATKYRRN
ncbi:MAG: helix-turn-helix domain-containing protein [Ruminococcaceae bacterium]|nr:helix-turn-helix domain-containing protein [Oscillospiraceae bacterium]